MPIKRQPLFQAQKLKDIKAGVDFVDVDGIFQRYLFPICREQNWELRIHAYNWKYPARFQVPL